VSRLAAALLAFAGLVQAILGVAAIGGSARLEENIREIETSANGGDLYFSLGLWGLILAACGAGVLAAAALLAAARPSGRLAGLVASFLAMAAAFFSLPIFRWPVVASIVLLGGAACVMAYGMREPD
jgi:hypothetical protein